MGLTSKEMTKLESYQLREFQIEELIDLSKDNMNVKDYSLMFILISKYTPYLVSNPTT